jgi:ferritin-like protein
VSNRFSRADLLSRGARGGVAVAAAGSAFGAFASVARADGLPDGDLAYLRLLIATELLGSDFYTNAAAAQPYRGAAAKELKLALANEGSHYATLSTIFSNAGQAPATAGDIDFTYPKGAFASAGAVTKLAVRLETLFLGAYLGAVAGVQTASLAQPIAQIAANQAQHLTVFSQLLGRSGFATAMPAPLTIDVVTQRLASFTG